MNITFKRDLSHSYMVVTGRMEPLEYEAGMLQNNDVKQLLSFHESTVNGQTQYWYDITGKRTLRDYFTQEKVSRKHLLHVMRQLNLACKQTAEYLIAQEHLLFTADSIFVAGEEEGHAVYLCYCPLKDKNIYNEFLTVTEHLISQVDHEDEELRRVCYNLYDASLATDFSLANAYEYVKELEAVQQEAPVIEEYSERCIQIRTPVEEPEVEEYEDESEEEATLLEQVMGCFRGWKEGLFGRLVDKRKELFPLPSESEDFIFDAEDVCEPKTQMLSEVPRPGITRLVPDAGTKGSEIMLGKDVISIGSKRGENDVVLESATVSRYHAKIRKNPTGEYVLEDLNSSNGTYCNGQILSYHEPHTLQYDDQVVFADVAYRVV